MIGRRAFLSGLPLLPLSAQPPAKDLLFSVDSTLVNVAFSVRDSTGRLLAGLNRDDFIVLENGAEQPVRAFAREEQLPLTLCLIMDRSPSQDQFDDENTYAAVTFFRRVLRPQDSAFVAAFGDSVKLIAESTSSLDDLERDLKQMRRHYRRAPLLGPDVRRSGGSAVLDSVYWAVKGKLASVGGRKAVIQIGDGKDTSSELGLVDTIDILQNSDTLFYALDNGGEDSSRSRRIRSRFPMLCEETGGRLFDTRLVPLREAFAEIEKELRTLYALAYAPLNLNRDGSYRKIEIKCKYPGISVRARPGYYAR